MPEIIKLSKNELRVQQNRLTQLQKYLPTLQLKKAMLQIEVNEAKVEIESLTQEFGKLRKLIESFSDLLSIQTTVDLMAATEIEEVKKSFENIAGVEVPYFEGINFKPVTYSLFDTPAWLDSAISQLQKMTESKAKVNIALEKKAALEKELREVSIRVNLFEKVLIPRALTNIRKIKVFLGDQQLAAVSQAKVAKAKIEKNKKAFGEQACALM